MIEPVSISKNAQAEIRKILTTKGIPADYGLRITVRGAGCGVALKLGFDQQKEGDLDYYVSDIHVFIQKKETLFMVGKRIEFYDESDGRGFMFVDEPVTP
jgi:iron-sulfur cluster assembly protein